MEQELNLQKFLNRMLEKIEVHTFFDNSIKPMKTAIFSWLPHCYWTDWFNVNGNRGFSKDQLKGKPFSLTF